MAEQNQEHTHFVQCEKGIINFLENQPTGRFVRVLHADKEKLIYSDSSLNEKDKFEGKEIILRNLELDKRVLEGIANAEFPNLDEKGIIALLPPDYAELDQHLRYRLKMLTAGKWGCSKPDLDDNNRLRTQQVDDPSNLDPDDPLVDIITQAIWHNPYNLTVICGNFIIRPYEPYTAFIRTKNSVAECWNKEIQKHIDDNSGNKEDIEFKYNEPFTCTKYKGGKISLYDNHNKKGIVQLLIEKKEKCSS